METIVRSIEFATKTGNDVYWLASDPAITIRQSEMPKNYVYLYEFRVTGTIQQIYNVFKNAGVTKLNINGEILDLSENTIETYSVSV